MNDGFNDPASSGRSKLDTKEFLRAVLGNVVLLLGLMGVERLFFGQGFYSSLVQHPFWIVVLIAAVQDGLYVGVAVAAAATLLMDWPPRPADADVTSHYIQIAVLPLQWLLAALCIGLFRQTELRKAKASAAEVGRLQKVADVLASDIVNLEAQIAREQLEKLSVDTSTNGQAELVRRVLALQESQLSDLSADFGALARICTPLPVSLLTMNAEGEFELDEADERFRKMHLEDRFDPALILSLRTSAEVIMDQTAPFEAKPEFEFVLLVGITSPDRRSLHGAVALLAASRKGAGEAADTAKFLAAVLGPVLTRIRTPKIAVTPKASERNSVRNFRRG